jgi:hypothetical protein
MMGQVISWKDYTVWLTESLSRLNGWRIAAFSIHSAEYMVRLNATILHEELPAAHEAIDQIRETLWHSVMEAYQLNESAVTRLEKRLDQVVPEDEFEALGVHPIAVDIIGCVSYAISCCQNHSIKSAEGAAISIINVIDHAGSGYSDTKMFVFPEMRQEQLRQAQVIDFLYTCPSSESCREALNRWLPGGANAVISRVFGPMLRPALPRRMRPGDVFSRSQRGRSSDSMSFATVWRGLPHCLRSC